MANIKIEVKGLREMERALLALQKEYTGKAAVQAMRPAVKAAMAPLEAKVSEGTPKDKGTLRESVAVKVGKPTRRMLYSQHYNSTTILAGRVGWFWTGRSLWTQALAVEFGTRETPANHTLEKVFDNEVDGMLYRFKTTLGPAIEKKAKSLAKKRAKST